MWFRTGVPVVVCASLMLAGCGSAPVPELVTTPTVDLAVPGSAQPTSYPLTIVNCGREVVFTRPPERVLILNGASVAEAASMVALDLDDRVLANAQSYGVSDQPGMNERIAALPQGGLTRNQQFDVPAEQVLASGADLVLSTWSGGFAAESGFATRDQLATAGINSLVNPVNCAMGNPDATAEELQVNRDASVRSSLEFLVLLGQIFDVQDRAFAVAGELAGRIEQTNATVAGRPAVKMLVVFPGMSAMNDSGLPAVLTGGIYDQVLAAAGGVSTFAGEGSDLTRTINTEQLAAAEVDLLVVGAFTPGETQAEDAQRLFDAFPDWTASRNRAFVAVSDGVYLGPTNAWAIEKIARAAHAGGL